MCCCHYWRFMSLYIPSAAVITGASGACTSQALLSLLELREPVHLKQFCHYWSFLSLYIPSSAAITELRKPVHPKQCCHCTVLEIHEPVHPRRVFHCIVLQHREPVHPKLCCHYWSFVSLYIPSAAVII